MTKVENMREREEPRQVGTKTREHTSYEADDNLRLSMDQFQRLSQSMDSSPEGIDDVDDVMLRL